jgi:hypothetical protein
MIHAFKVTDGAYGWVGREKLGFDLLKAAHKKKTVDSPNVGKTWEDHQ